MILIFVKKDNYYIISFELSKILDTLSYNY